MRSLEASHPAVTVLLATFLAAGCPAGSDGPVAEPVQSERLSVATALGDLEADSLDGFARALEPRALRFPADHGPHPDFKTEWWYWIGHLEADDGRRFGYQLTFFRSALAPPGHQAPSGEGGSSWATRDVIMAHFALSDIDGERFHSFERFSRNAAGLAGAQAAPFRVWLDDWSVEEGAAPETWHLRARAGGIELDLNLDSGKPRVLHGERGLSRKGTEPGAASLYYSYTRMPTIGRLLMDGHELEVEGSSWLDREWSTSLLAADEVGWDWLGAQFDDGRELMLFRLRRRDGTSAWIAGTLVAGDGSARPVDVEGARLERRDSWTSPETGITYPAGFRLELPREALRLDLVPLLADQELRQSFVYWEGAVAISGTLAGRGYLELTGYAGSSNRASPR